LFLSNAVWIAKKYLQAGDIVLFNEVPFEHEDLPGIGFIGGSLDYLTSEFEGVDDILKSGGGTVTNAHVRPKSP
jgi:hypothetical protein